MGSFYASIFKSIGADMDSANMKIHPEVYFSVVGFLSVVSLSIPIGLSMLFITGIWKGNPALPLNGLVLIPASLIAPVLVVVFGFIIPKTISTNRMSSLQIEIPYASMYISVMVSGGLSPFESFLRMRKMNLLPNMQDEVSRIQTIVMSTGTDPVSAMEQAGKQVNLKQYNELLLGYASSVRTGGDTLHYLFNQTHSMFRGLTTTVKAKGESAAMLMEAYTIIGILGVLGLFLVFVVGMSIPTAGVSISPDLFFFFSFVVMPFMSVIFLYAGDASQFNYPVSNWKPYYVFLGTVPFALFLATQTALPFFDDKFIIIPALPAAIQWIRGALGCAEGTEAAIGVTVTLIFLALPAVFADHITVGRDASILDGITQFLRDLVEVRKSGLSPEKSIEALSRRDYKVFSRHLRNISTKINWGYPLRQIYEEFAANVKNWIALVNIYLLIDTIEVGGGSERSVESLAEFSESTKQLEAEKKAALMPLLIVPYIGAALLTGTTVMFLGFFTGGSLGVSVPTKMLFKTLLTPLAIHSFTLGLVTGKITSGRVSAGFKHSVLLSLVSLGGIWLISNMDMGGGLI